MAKKQKESVRLSRADDDESINSIEEEEVGFFDRLFSPGTIDTDVSGDEDTEFDDSVGSGTIYTDMTGRSDEDSDESSTASTLILFDKELRAKHRSACKNMTVGIYLSQLFPISFDRLFVIILLKAKKFSFNIYLLSLHSYLDRQICKSDQSI